MDTTPNTPAVADASLPTPTPAERLNDLRRRVLNDQPLSVEEYAEVIASMRVKRAGDTAAAGEKKAAKVAKAASTAAPMALDDLFKSVGL